MSAFTGFQYLLVLPNGDVKGFEDLDMTKAYINMYYDKKVRHSNVRDEYNDITDNSDEFVNTICHNLGVVEGECRVYDTMQLIEKLQDELVFDDEKQEVISKLMEKDIELNIYEYTIDNIFNDVETISVMENYGENFKNF